MLSLTSGQITGILTDTGTSVGISNDLFDDTVLSFTGETVLFTSADNTLKELMVANASGGTLTITQRGLDQSETKTTDTTLQKEWRTGTIVRVVASASDLPDKDADWTQKDSTKIQFGSTSAYITTTDTGTNLKFKDGSNAEITLSTLAAGAGADTKVAISTLDTTPSQLENKLTAGDGVTLTKVNPSANESLDLDVDLTDSTIFTTVQGNADRALKTDGSGNIDTSFAASETVEGIVEKLTNAEAIAKTDTTRYATSDQFRLMLNDGDFDVVYDMDLLGNSSNFSGALVGGTLISTGQTYNCSASVKSMTFSGTSTGFEYDFFLKEQGNAAQNLTFTDIDIIEFEFNGNLTTTTGDLLFGITDGTDGITHIKTSTARKVMIQGNNTNIVLNTADGTTQSDGTSFSTTNPVGVTNYKVVFDVGTDVKIFQDGTLRDTKTTNLPSGGSQPRFGFGFDRTSSTGTVTFDRLIVRIKYV